MQEISKCRKVEVRLPAAPAVSQFNNLPKASDEAPIWDWQQVHIEQLMVGDVVRMFEADGTTPVVGVEGGTEWVVAGQPCFAVEELPSGRTAVITDTKILVNTAEDRNEIIDVEFTDIEEHVNGESEDDAEAGDDPFAQ